MALGVVEDLQSDDVDVDDDKRRARPAAAIQLVVEIGQARSARACSRQRVGLRDGNLPRERLAVHEGAQPLTGGLFAVVCGGLAVLGGKRSLGGGLRAVLRRTLALSGCFGDSLGARDRTLIEFPLVGGVALCHREIARVGGPVSRKRGEITGVRGRVTLAGGVQSRLGAVLAAQGAALADLAAELVRLHVAAGREVPVAGGLIAIRSQLLAVGARLVAVRARLIGVRQRMVAVGTCPLAIERLLVLERRSGGALLLSLDPPVGGIHGRIA